MSQKIHNPFKKTSTFSAFAHILAVCVPYPGGLSPRFRAKRAQKGPGQLRRLGPECKWDSTANAARRPPLFRAWDLLFPAPQGLHQNGVAFVHRVHPAQNQLHSHRAGRSGGHHRITGGHHAALLIHIKVVPPAAAVQLVQAVLHAGQLVFAAFSGSHQDAIAKGMAYRKEHGEHRWTCPYIPIDPHDIGRTYDADVIRINSQSGKGGIGFVLEQNYGYNLPPKMREALGYKVKSVSDHSHKELSAGEVLHIFEDTFLNKSKPLSVVEAHFAQVNGITATVTLDLNGQRKVVTSVGNGRLDAVANAIQSATGMDFHLETYSEHSLDEGSTSRAASYVGLEWGDGIVTWGAGTDTDIIVAGIHALVSAINNK